MSTVQQRYDETTGRWLLSSAERTAVTTFTELAPGLWVSRDSDGVIAECLVARDQMDAIPFAVRELVTAELGWVSEDQATSDIVVRSGANELPTTTVIHEPGIPYSDDKGNVLVPTDAGTVKVSLSDSILMIDVPVQANYEWVRISDASTGQVLALGRVQRFGDVFGANVTFALDGTDIHIALTDAPLDPVADRRTRRSQWLDDVLVGLRRQWWRHPWRTRDAARDAIGVARSLGDISRERTARRFARVVPIAFACTVMILAACASALTVALLPGQSTHLVVRGSTGAVYDFEGQGSVTVAVGTGPTGTVDLVMEDAIVGQQKFGPGIGGTSAFRAACRNSKNLVITDTASPVVTAKYVVSIASGDGESVLLGTVEMNSEASTFSSIDKSCDTALPAADGSIIADVVYHRNTEEFTLPAPTKSLDANSRWSLSIERVSPGPDSVSGKSRTPVVLVAVG